MRARLLLLLLSAALLAGPQCGTPNAADLQARIDAAGPGGIVAIEGTWSLCRRVQPLEGQTWEGSGVLRRCAVPRTVLTAPASAGATSVAVADSAGFVAGVGHHVGFGEGALEDGEGACDAHYVQAAGPGTIQFSSGLCQGYPAGTPVYVAFHLVEVRETDVTLRGFTLDGNEAQQPAYHAWAAATANLLTQGAHRLLVEDLTVKAAWGDGIRLLDSDYSTLDGVEIEDTRCSGVHIGGNRDLLVDDSTFRDVGHEALACGHSEGALTYSLNNVRLTVRDTCFERVHTPWGAIARMNLEDNLFLDLEGNTACDGPHLFATRLSGAGRITATDNQAHTTDEIFSVDGASLFTESGTEAIGPCTCE